MKNLALFMHHPECSEQCAYATIHSLSSNYNIRVFNEKELDDDRIFYDTDVIVFPGGVGDSDSYANFFTRRRANRVANFIHDGGCYLGICMGAYWAGSRYFDILDDIEPEQYIKRSEADIKRSYATVASVTWNGKKEDMFFYDGCSLLGDENKFKTIARYSNGDPMAIIQGRIGLIGCHPEAEKNWYESPRQYINKYWNGGSHQKLLLEFTDELTRKN